MGLTTYVRRKRLERSEDYRALLALVAEKVRPKEPELALVEHLADPRGTFLDVGADRGFYCVVALPGFGRVVAVEAHPDLAAGLRRTFGSTVTVVERALSDRSGTTTMWVSVSKGVDVDFRGSLQEDANPGFDQREIEVETTRVDDLGLSRLTLLKVDVHNFLLGCGYRGVFVHRGVVRPLAEFCLEGHQVQGNAKAVGAPKSSDYVNNFLFVPQERDVPLPRTVA